MTEKMLTLAERVALAAKGVGGKLAPDKINKEQNYDYLSADLILSEAGQALAEQGVTIFPAVTDEQITSVDRSPKPPRYDAKVTMAFTIAGAGEALAFPWVGRGSDYSVPDKAMYKAITSAHKYFLMKLLNIGAGNEDGEHETAEAPKQPAAKQAKPAPVNGKIEQAGPYQWLIADGLVDNIPHAVNLAKLLELKELDEGEQRDRVSVYQSWRAYGLDPKPAAAQTLAGNLPEVEPTE